MSRRTSRQRRCALPFLPWAAITASRYRAILLGAVLLGSAAGCGAPAPEIGADTARTLQAQVLAVTEAAASDDPAGSLKLLDELGIKLDQAGGSVSHQRRQSIQTAIDAVRADLTSRQAAAEAARAAAEQAAAAQAAAEQAAAEQAAAEQAAAAASAGAPPPAVVAPAPVPADSAKDKGKGQDGGKGQGKG